MKAIEMCDNALSAWTWFDCLLVEAKMSISQLRTQEELRVVENSNGELHMFGDLHGDEQGVKKLREIVAQMDENENICLGLLGDIAAAQGPCQLEALCLVLSAMVAYPERTFVCKGNCEVDRMILTAEGLPLEVYEKWGLKAFGAVIDMVCEVFDLLPTWLSFPHMGLLVCHGGPIRPVDSLGSLELSIPQFDQWGDFDEEHRGLSTPVGPRGVSYSRTFGPDRVLHVLKTTDHSVLLRGHQSGLLKKAGRGLHLACDGRLATIHTCHKSPSRHLMVVDMGVKIDQFDESNFVEI